MKRIYEWLIEPVPIERVMMSVLLAGVLGIPLGLIIGSIVALIL